MAVQRVQLPISFQYLDTNGKLIPVPTGTTVFVLDRNTAALTTVYSAATGGTIVSPLQTDSSGALAGWVVEGSYTLSVIANPAASPPYGGTSVAWEAIRGDGAEAIAPGVVTSTHIASSLAPFLLTSGMMLDYAGSTPPSGFLMCDGTAYSTITYANLFGVLGYAFGGSGPTFNVPDYRGRASIGVGTGTGGAASGTGPPTGGNALTTRARSDWTGSETHTITTSEMSTHNHNVIDPTHSHAIFDPGHQHFASGSSGGQSALHNHVPNYGTGKFYTTASSSVDGADTYRAYATLNPFYNLTSFITSDHSHSWSAATDARSAGIAYLGAFTGVSINYNITTASPYSLLQPFLALNKIIKT